MMVPMTSKQLVCYMVLPACGIDPVQKKETGLLGLFLCDENVIFYMFYLGYRFLRPSRASPPRPSMAIVTGSGMSWWTINLSINVPSA